MKGFGQLNFVGNLGADPEMRFTPEGVPVTSFNVAVSNGKDTERPYWLKCNCWRGLAEVANQYLHKGSSVFGSGDLLLELWTDKAGKERQTLKVVLSHLVFLDKKPGGADVDDGKQAQSAGAVDTTLPE